MSSSRNRVGSARFEFWSLLLTVALAPASAGAQEIPRDEYLRFLPLEVPKAVGQTASSAAFQLYGDPTAPGFIDNAPRDGIDDRRMRVLEALGVQFAPFLVQSSEMVPLDFRAFARGGGLPLQVDLWETAMVERLITEGSVDWLGENAPPCPTVPDGSADCRVLELLDSYHPDRPGGAIERARAVTPQSAPFELLWLNFPGSGPKSWKAYYEDDEGRLREDLRGDLKTYLHPFIERLPGDGEPVYQLILQYWFFYPYNDGGNNHEGDWEHIHVVVSPRDRVTAPGLSAGEIREILDGERLASDADDALVMKRVEYYFHSKVVFLDFSSPNVYEDRSAWERESRELRGSLTGGDYWRRYARFMAYEDAAETRVNTHPIGYIGADNKGFDQLLSPPGSTNRDSHGTYPAPGLFKDIGPGGATEDVHPSFNHKDFYASSEEEQRATLGQFSRGGVVFLGEPGIVEVVPDYETVIDLVMTDVAVRRRWAWLVLPIRWGYPAHESPFAGIVPHAETGNVSIVGPAFNTGWNRSGENQQYKTYDVHVLPRLFPTSLQDGFSNDFGFLNLTIPTLSFLPPFDALWRIVAAPIRAIATPLDRVFYPAATVPFRFVGIRGGVAIHFMHEDYSDLLFNATQGPELVVRLEDHVNQNAGPGTEVTGGSTVVENQVSSAYFIDLYVGRHLVTTNGLRHGRSRIASTVAFNDINPFVVDAELNMWEYAGSVRYNIRAERIQPFVRAGYGLSWYRLEDFSTNGDLIATPESDWIRQPGFFHNLLPNTWHYGLGIEVIPIHRFAHLPGGLDFGLTLEWQHFSNKLGLDQLGVDITDLILLGTAAEDLPKDRRVGRHSFTVSLAVSW